MMLEEIPNYVGQLSVSKLCSDLHVNRSGYYA